MPSGQILVYMDEINLNLRIEFVDLEYFWVQEIKICNEKKKTAT